MLDQVKKFLKTLNKAELIVGAVYGLALSLLIGPAALLLAPVTAVLWATGGAGYGKAWRRIGVPLTTAVFLHTPAYLAAYAVVFGLLTIGYGIPDVNDPVGSTLGRFFHKLFKGRAPYVDWATRGTIYAGMAAAFWAAHLVK